jgi:hypothetical protein
MTGSNNYSNENFATLNTRKSSSGKLLFRIASAAAVGGIIFATLYIMASSRTTMNPLSTTSSDTALFDDAGRYVMRNYDDIKPNSNFLAGLGGIWGVPMVRLNFLLYLNAFSSSSNTKLHFTPSFSVGILRK